MKYIPYLIYTILFFTIWGLRPPISSDSFHGLSDRPLNILNSFNPKEYSSVHAFNLKNEQTGLVRDKESPVLYFKTSETIYPLMLENKHSGITIVLYKIFSKLFSPLWGFVVWHFLGGLLILFLLIRVLKKIYDKEIVQIGSLLACGSPFLIYLYAFFISEILALAVFLYILGDLYHKRVNYIKVGALIALGLLIRVNFLWLAVALLPFIGKDFKSYLKIALSTFLFSIPHILMVDWSTFFNRVSDFQMSFGFVENITYFIFSLANSWRSFIFLWNENYQVMLLSPVKLFGFDFVGILIIVLSTYIIVKLRKAERRNLKKYFLSLFLFSCALFFSIKVKVDYTNYFYPIFIFQILIFSELVKYSSRKWVSYLLLGLVVLNSSMVFHFYLRNDVVTRHNAKVALEVIKEVKHRDGQLYTIGESDIGKYEYLSSSKVRPIHLSKTLINKEFKSFVDLLDNLESGTLAVPFQDEWSGWHWHWGRINPDYIKNMAKKFDVKIFNEKIIKKSSGEKAVWIFDFKKGKS